MSENEIIVLVGSEVWRIGAALGFGAVVGAGFAVLLLSVVSFVAGFAVHLGKWFMGSKNDT